MTTDILLGVIAAALFLCAHALFSIADEIRDTRVEIGKSLWGRRTYSVEPEEEAEDG